MLDFEDAISLLVSNEWSIDGDIKDSWSSLDARIGGERCHETAILALILGRLVITYLRDSKLLEEFKVKDIYVDNSDRYNHIMGLSAWTLESLSVLTTTECSLSIWYRHLGDVLVATSKEQRAAGMGEYYNAECPLRTTFTHFFFKLIERSSAQILPKRVSAKPFGPKPRAWETLPEQA